MEYVTFEIDCSGTECGICKYLVIDMSTRPGNIKPRQIKYEYQIGRIYCRLFNKRITCKFVRHKDRTIDFEKTNQFLRCQECIDKSKEFERGKDNNIPRDI